MKTPTTLVFAGVLAALAAFPAIADDVRPDVVVDLLEQGTIKPLGDLNDVALGLHPEATIVDTELEREHGTYVYKVELRDSNGLEWDVDINAENGTVVENRRDD